MYTYKNIKCICIVHLYLSVERDLKCMSDLNVCSLATDVTSDNKYMLRVRIRYSVL